MRPEDLSGFELCAGELSANPEGVDFLACNGWGRFGSEVTVKAVTVATVLFDFPECFAGFGIKGLQDFVLSNSVVENGFSIGNYWTTVSISNFDFP